MSSLRAGADGGSRSHTVVGRSRNRRRICATATVSDSIVHPRVDDSGANRQSCRRPRSRVSGDGSGVAGTTERLVQTGGGDGDDLARRGVASITQEIEDHDAPRWTTELSAETFSALNSGFNVKP